MAIKGLLNKLSWRAGPRNETYRLLQLTHELQELVTVTYRMLQGALTKSNQCRRDLQAMQWQLLSFAFHTKQ